MIREVKAMFGLIVSIAFVGILISVLVWTSQSSNNQSATVTTSPTPDHIQADPAINSVKEYIRRSRESKTPDLAGLISGPCGDSTMSETHQDSGQHTGSKLDPIPVKPPNSSYTRSVLTEFLLKDNPEMIFEGKSTILRVDNIGKENGATVVGVDFGDYRGEFQMSEDFLLCQFGDDGWKIFEVDTPSSHLKY